MRIPGANEAMEHIVSWARKGHWREECGRMIAQHFEPVCAKAGMDEDDLAELLGENLHSMVEGCAFEDFLSSRVGPKGRNIIDDYLDQRGWKESIQGRDYLRALRGSLLSLYEVIEANQGRSLVLRDLIRGGAPIEVDERLGSQDAVKWDRLAARVLSIGGRRFLSGAVLHFPHEPAEAVQRIFRTAPEKTRQGLGDLLPNLSEENKRAIEETLTDASIALEGGATAITSVWLAYTINQLTAPLPQLTNFDGEQVVFAKVRFPLHDRDRAHQAGHHGLADPSQGETDHGDAQLDTVDDLIEILVKALNDAGADAAGIDQLLNARIADADQREFGCREEGIGCHQEQDQKDPEQHIGDH